MNLVYGSVCSGIEAATVAWEGLGWRPAFFAEIDRFASAVLAHHYPHVVNYGDFRHVPIEWRGAVDVMVAGTPCQSFSIAGRRAGLDDSRGNLTLEFFDLVGRLRPRWVVWENVPGVLSQDGGRAFGTVLGKVEQLGYEFAWRTLDAQYFGVPQRRRRVFLVCHSGELERRTGASSVQVQGRFRNLPAAVLFERHSLSGDSAPSRTAWQATTSDVAGSLGGGGERGWANDLDRSGAFIPRYWDGGDVADCLDVSSMQKQQMMPERRRFPAVLASSEIPVAFSAKDHGSDALEDTSPTLRSGNHDHSHANAGVMPAKRSTARSQRRDCRKMYFSSKKLEQ